MGGVHRLREWILISLFMAVLPFAVLNTGCSSPRKPKPITRLPEDPLLNLGVNAGQSALNRSGVTSVFPQTGPSLGPTNSMVIAQPNLVAKPTPLTVASWATNESVKSDWISVSAWSIRQGKPVPELSLGSHVLKTAGVRCFLGFEPRSSGGSLYLHPLDVQKTLEPLLKVSPLVAHRTVMLDPGHGGMSVGTRSIVGNRYEKEFSLDWARRLQPLLEARGWRVFLTRTNDFEVGLAERVRLADTAGADLFISLHFNSAFPNQAPSGIETYCLTPSGMPSTLVRGYPDDVTVTFPNNAYDAENLRLGFRIQRSLLSLSGASDRGIRRARFMEVLRGQKRAAVLIEGGYLSNPEDARRIGTPEYRQRLALGVAQALEAP